MRSKPRLLFVGLDWRPVGGLEIYNRYLAQALVSAGCEVEVWAVWQQSPVPLDSGQALPLAPRTRLGLSLYARFAWRKLLAWRLQRVLPKYDLVIVGHMHLLSSVHSARLRCSRWPPYWVWTYGVDAWGPFSPGLLRALANARCVVAISDYTAKVVSNKLANYVPIPIVPNPVDTELFRPAPIPPVNESKVLLTVSRLSSRERYKGHEVVMQALPLIEAKLNVPVLYRIVGGGDYRGYLQSFAERLGVADSVQFAGRVSLATLIQTYQACDVFVMPSRVEQRADGTWLGEGFGSVYIEAAACGRPVIASNQGGAAEAVQYGQTGFAVDPTSPQAVAEAACAILRDSDLAARMGRAGRCFVEENFSLPVFQRRVADLLRRHGF